MGCPHGYDLSILCSLCSSGTPKNGKKDTAFTKQDSGKRKKIIAYKGKVDHRILLVDYDKPR